MDLNAPEIQQILSDYSDQVHIDPKIDHRTKLTPEQAKEYPYCCLALLRLKNKSLEVDHYCTAYLVSNTLAITTAHALFHKHPNNCMTQAQPVQLYPLNTGQMKSPIKIVDYRMKPQYRKAMLGIGKNECSKEQWQYFRKKTKNKYDYMLLKLDQPVHLKEYIEISYNHSQNKTHNIQICGFPGEKSYRKVGSERAFYDPYTQSGLCKRIENYNIFYEIDTTSGQSGSPILIKQEGKIYAIGTHKAGLKVQKCNFGILWTQENVEHLLAWEKEMKIGISAHQLKPLAQTTARKKQAAPRAKSPQNNLSLIQKSKQPRGSKAFSSQKLNLSYTQKLKKSNLPKPTSSKKLLLPQPTPSLQISWLPSKYFDIEGQTIVRNGCQNDKQKQMIFKDPFPCRGNFKFKFQVSHGANGQLCVGLMTEGRRDYPSNGSVSDKDTTGYWVKNTFFKGRVCINGVKQTQWQQQLFVDKGYVLQMQLSISQKVTLTYSNSNRQLHYDVTQFFKGKPIYLFLSAKNNQDAFRIIT